MRPCCEHPEQHGVEAVLPASKMQSAVKLHGDRKQLGGGGGNQGEAWIFQYLSVLVVVGGLRTLGLPQRSVFVEQGMSLLLEICLLWGDQ